MAVVVSRNRVNPSPHVPIEHSALPKPGFVLGRQSVAVPEPHRWVVVVLVVPITRDLPTMVIEPRMILPVLTLVVAGLIAVILTLSTVLCLHCTAG